MRIQRLKSDYNQQVRNNGDVLNAISKVTEKSIGTVRNWFYNDSEMLTMYSVLVIIAASVNVNVDDLLTEVLEEAVA